MEKHLALIVKILIPAYAVLALLFAQLVHRCKQESDATNYCMNYVYRELDRINEDLDNHLNPEI